MLKKNSPFPINRDKNNNENNDDNTTSGRSVCLFCLFITSILFSITLIILFRAPWLSFILQSATIPFLSSHITYCSLFIDYCLLSTAHGFFNCGDTPQMWGHSRSVPNSNRGVPNIGGWGTGYTLYFFASRTELKTNA